MNAQTVKAIRQAFATMSQQDIGTYGYDILHAREQSATQAMRTWIAIALHMGFEETKALAITLSPDNSTDSKRQYAQRLNNLVKNAIANGHVRKINDFSGTFKELVALAAPVKDADADADSDNEPQSKQPASKGKKAPAPKAAELSAAFDMLESLISEAAAVTKPAQMRELLTRIASQGAEALAAIKG